MATTSRPATHPAPTVRIDPTSVVDDRAAARLTAELERLVTRRRLPHAVVAVARRDGSQSWIGAAGAADPAGTPMRPDTPYCIASVTKLYIGATVLRLAERRQLDLDAPITTYLAEEVTRGLHRLDGVDQTPRITVRHLLSHTSGLPDYLEDRPRGERSWYQQMAAGTDLAWTFEDLVGRTRDELTPAFAPQDPSAPRQRARYSDTGFQLLIAIIEAVTGSPAPHAFEDELFRPLGLTHTYLPDGGAPIEPTGPPATVYRRTRPLDIPQALVSLRDLVSTASDTVRFMQALTCGEVFDDPATLALMHERFNRIHYPLRYGLATMRYDIPRLYGPGRQRVTLLGHAGATGTWLFHCPELDLILAGSVDQVNGRALPFRLLPRLLRAAHA